MFKIVWRNARQIGVARRRQIRGKISWKIIPRLMMCNAKFYYVCTVDDKLSNVICN